MRRQIRYNSRNLINLRKRILNQGCIVDTYITNKPTAIDSIEKLRKASDLGHSFLDNSLFSEPHQCIEFIHNILLKIKNKSDK